MEERLDISVIIPIHQYNDGVNKYFDNAIKSVAEQIMQVSEIIIVAKSDKELLEYLSNYDYKILADRVRIIENEGETDFATQFNLGVSKATTKWVSLLEYDDEYSKIWFKNFNIYSKANPEVGLFLPIIVDVDEEGNYIGFMNEAVWANEFSEELGVLDLDALLRYQNFNFDGMVMERETFLRIGGIKSNIKLTFIYEFLLRAVYQSVRTMVIPKLGYKHVNMRDGSLFDNLVKLMDSKESMFWLEVAKKEYEFDYDRNITYDENNGE